jgi:hypothetical protein
MASPSPISGPVVFLPKKSQPEAVPAPKSAQLAAAQARRRSRRAAALTGAVVVGAGVAVGAFVLRADHAEVAPPVDAAAPVYVAASDAPTPFATPPDAPLPKGRPDAAPRRSSPAPPDAAVQTRADAAPVATAPPRQMVTVTIVTRPPDGAILHGGKELRHGGRISGLEGTKTTVTCSMYRREPGRVTIVFDRDKTEVCEMAELKNPFEPE